MVHKDQRFHWVAVSVRMACILWYKCLFAYKCIVFHDEPVTGTKKLQCPCGGEQSPMQSEEEVICNKIPSIQ